MAAFDMSANERPRNSPNHLRSSVARQATFPTPPRLTATQRLPTSLPPGSPSFINRGFGARESVMCSPSAHPRLPPSLSRARPLLPSLTTSPGSRIPASLSIPSLPRAVPHLPPTLAASLGFGSHVSPTPPLAHSFAPHPQYFSPSKQQHTRMK